MHSDSDDNVDQVDADDAEAQAEIRTPTSSAVRPRVEDHIESSEDEVVWKGRLNLRNTHPSTKRRTKASSIPGAEPSFDRRSEAAKNKMTAPGYSYPYSSAFYQPYAQSFWPYSLSYPSIYPPVYPPVYPPAYPRFYASPGPHKIPNPTTQNGLAQQNPRDGEQSNVAHLDDRAGLETTITRNRDPRTRSVTFSSETATTSKKRTKSKRKKSKLTNENTLKADKQSDYAVSGSLSYEDPISLSRDNNDIWDENVAEPVVEESPSPPEPEPSSPPDGEKSSDWGSSSIWGASKKNKKIKRKKNQFVEPDSTPAALPEPIVKDAASVGQSVAFHSGSQDHPLYPNVDSASILASTLHRGQYKPLDEVNPEPILEEDTNRSHVPYLAIEDAQSMLKDAAIHEPFSQRAPRIDLAGEHIVRRATHTNPNGLVIPVTVQNSHTAFYSQFSMPSQMKWPDHRTSVGNRSMNVNKAVSAKRLRRRDGSYSMELYCDEGPSSTKKDGDYQMQWLHLQTNRLNLTEFENARLSAPGINGKTKVVLLTLLEQVQAKHQKQLFDGYSIEPGTVLRCYGNSPGDAEVMQPSATFMCFPYLSVDMRKRTVHPPVLDHPTRSVLQTLYPYESTAFREEPPSFCSDQPAASDRVLYVPQCWIVILNSDIVISCAELDSNDITKPAVSLSNHKKNVPLVEEYPIEDDDSDASSMTSTFDSPLQNVDATTPHETTDGMIPQPHVAADDLNDGDRLSTQSHSFKVAKPTRMPPSTLGGPHIDADLASLDTTSPANDCHKAQSKGLSLTIEDVSEVEESILAVLNSLKKPQMTTEYLSRFKMEISRILGIWSRAPQRAQKREGKILERLQDGVARAGLLRNMCDLESESTEFSSNLTYRDAILKALGIEDSSLQKELENLGDVVKIAMTLFKGIQDSNTTKATRFAKGTLEIVKPFLTWVLIDAGIDQKVNVERVAAEYLHAMMQEIEQSLCQRDERSYTSSRELTISDLEHLLSTPAHHERTPS